MLANSTAGKPAVAPGEQNSVVGLEEAFSDKGREHFRLLAEFGENEFAAKLKPFAYKRSDEHL